MILIATVEPDSLGKCSRALKGNGTVVSPSEPDEICDTVAYLMPSLLLMDVSLIDPGQFHYLARIKLLSPRTRILMRNVAIDDHLELELFTYGVRGCCPPDASEDQIGKAAFALVQGEYWIRRGLASRILDTQLNSKHNERSKLSESAKVPTNLTARESEIARLVGQGNSNKQIARQLEVTERTVKSHLTEVFRKTGVTDRLSLALKMKKASHSSIS